MNIKIKNCSLAKGLRKNSTEAEKLLWRRLRACHFEESKFRRQEPIGDYIVDFVCFKRKLIIEVDGGQHALSDNDVKRDEWFRGQGFKILRFWNNEVLRNIEGVLEKIKENF